MPALTREVRITPPRAELLLLRLYTVYYPVAIRSLCLSCREERSNPGNTLLQTLTPLGPGREQRGSPPCLFTVLSPGDLHGTHQSCRDGDTEPELYTCDHGGPREPRPLSVREDCYTSLPTLGTMQGYPPLPTTQGGTLSTLTLTLQPPQEAHY